MSDKQSKPNKKSNRNQQSKWNKNAGSSGPVSSSLVYKLNAWHLGRLFQACIVMDILIILAVCATFLYCRYGDFALIDYKSLIIVDKVKNTITLHEDLQKPFSMLWNASIIVVVLQLLGIAANIGGSARAIRKRLRPIAELTRTAKNISTSGFPSGSAGAGARHSDQEIRNLAGAISNIEADRLDTRITVDDAQRELKDLASAINDLLDRIDQAYRAQIRFVSDASHELRTPIAVIQGYANLLDRWGKNDEKTLTESIDAIKAEAESMKNLVEQLLFLARGDADTMTLRMEDVNVSELAAEIVKETQMIDPNHIFIAKPDADVKAVADEQLIKQAVRIFIDNAVKYTPSGEIISIGVKRAENRAVLTIQDNGIGIPADDVPYVFDRFFRADESRARRTGGAGLGMSIAKWIINRHEGSVEVLSREDFGTRVTIRIPLAAKENEMQATTS